MTKLSDLLEKENVYYMKIAAIYSLKAIALSTSDVELTQIIAFISKSVSSAVPNVRLSAAKSLRLISKKYNNQGITEDCQKAIATLSEDTDKDIKQFIEDCKASW